VKIQSIQTTGAINNTAARPQAQPAFRGGADSLIRFWDVIERGGWVGNFMLQDVGGNNIPRIAISLNRNKEELGHLNYAAGGEALIREALSGPSMVVVPLGVMALSTRLAGETTKIPMKNIADFSEIMKSTLKGVGEGAKTDTGALRKAFYTNVLDAMGEHSLGGNKDFTTEALTKITEIESMKLPKTNIFKRFFDKPFKKAKKAKKQAVSNLQEAFANFKQQRVPHGEDFLSAKIAAKGKETVFTDFTTQMKGYFDDFAKKGLKAGEDGTITLPKGVDTFADKFKNLRTGQRFITGIAMTGLMMAVLSIIPKLYSFNKTSPELSKHSKEAQPQQAQGGGK